jgi:hypothetical protein
VCGLGGARPVQFNCHGRNRCSFPSAQRLQHRLGDHMYAWPKGRNDTIVPQVVSRLPLNMIYIFEIWSRNILRNSSVLNDTRSDQGIRFHHLSISLRCGSASPILLFCECCMLPYMRVKFLFHVDAGLHSKVGCAKSFMHST